MKNSTKRQCLSLFALSAFAGGIYFVAHQGPKTQINQINIFVPFTLTTEINPRSIKTVGDQTVAEHIFAFHSREDVRDGYASVVSDVKFDRSAQIITLRPKYALKTGTGQSITKEQICESIRTSFEGTQHAPYRSLLKSVECDESGAVISLKFIPVNMEFLFTIPDFSIYLPSQVPITPEHLFSSPGPYQIQTLSQDSLQLVRNKYYPKELIANEVEKVKIEHFDSGSAKDFIKIANPENQHLAYFHGHSVSPDDLESLTSRGYRIQKFPSEWVVFVGFNLSVSKEDRIRIANVLDLNRSKLMESAILGQAAFSIPPSDRPFGMSKDEYEKAKPKPNLDHGHLSKPLKIGTRSEWFEIPIFKKTMEALKSKFPELELVKMHGPIYGDRDKSGKYEADIFLLALGVSPADPLTHIAFLTGAIPSFKNFLSDTQQSELATISDASEFTKLVKEIENRILKERLLVPLAHFPGVVVEAPRFKRDSNLAWAWGIQAWTYHVDQ